jgi:hypothetical protein
MKGCFMGMVGLMSLIVIAGVCQFANAGEAPKLQLFLSVAVNADQSLSLEFVVKNQTDMPFSEDISDQSLPVRVSIWNERGEDLYRFAYANEKKDGKSGRPGTGGQHVVPLNLRPGEIKEYEQPIAMVLNAEGHLSPLPPGKYRIQARLATVELLNGRYETTLYQSNNVEIVLQEG